MGLAALAITTSLLRRLPRYERPHRLDIVGAVLIVLASVSFMLALNLGGVRYPWVSLPVLALFSAALVIGAGFVFRLLTAPEPLIPLTILRHPIVRCAITINTFGWGAIIGLNIMLPMYLQNAMGLSPTNAGLSLIVFMVSLNTSAGLAGQVLGRVRHYKLLPMLFLALAITAVATLAWRADSMTPLWFELLLVLTGLGFGPLPSLTAVAMQNVVARHQLGISVGSMTFSRNLYITMLIAVFGAIILAGVPVRSELEPGAALAAQSAQAFGWVFMVAAASLAAALIAMLAMEERPLRTGAEAEVA
jgi:predicted MFS family arabinose efflux permease